MYASNITTAARRLETFGLTSKRFSLYLLALSVIVLISVTVFVPGFSLFQILTGACMLILPTSMYFSSTVLVATMRGVHWCKLNQPEFSKRFNFSLNGPFDGVRWFDMILNFGSGIAVMLVDVFSFGHFGVYPILLALAAGYWLYRMFRLYREFRCSVKALEAHAKTIETPVDEVAMGYVTEAKKGNIEVIIDQRDLLSTL